MEELETGCGYIIISSRYVNLAGRGLEWDLDVHATLLVLSSREIDLNYSEQTDWYNYIITRQYKRVRDLQDAGRW